MNTADVTAAPSSIIIKGQTYLLSPLTDGDFGEFERWAQDRYMNVAKRNLEGLTTEQQQIVLTGAVESAARITITTPQALQLMTSLEGAGLLVYLSLRHRHPDLEKSTVMNWLTDPKILKATMDRIDRLNAVKKRGRRKRKRGRQ